MKPFLYLLVCMLLIVACGQNAPSVQDPDAEQWLFDPPSPLRGSYAPDDADFWYPGRNCDWDNGAAIVSSPTVAGPGALRITKSGCLVHSRISGVPAIANDPQPRCPLRPYRIGLSVYKGLDTCTGSPCAEVAIYWYDTNKKFLYKQYDNAGPVTTGEWVTKTLDMLVTKEARFFSLAVGGPTASMPSSPIYFDEIGVDFQQTWAPIVIRDNPVLKDPEGNDLCQ
jgi:hypothetical protein